ncbi:MAG: TatD family hydrolase [Gammaproteobacteria bacterium]|nr:TatD family hydrolase [Gammaproteobacteria bacterium]
MLDLIDIGLNLTHDSFADDRDAVIGAAVEAGVNRMIVTGTTVTASVQAAELATTLPERLFATAGIHPHHAAELDRDSLASLEALLATAPVVAVGECGLDYFRNFSPRDAQLAAFEAQLELAAGSGMPVFLHQRDAHDDMLRLLGRYRSRLVGGVAHCFTGTRDELAAYLDLDLFVGITGWICDERRGESLRQAIVDLPLDRLLVETDAPYLTPRDLPAQPKSRRNEPKYLPHIVARIAALKQADLAEVAAASTRNAEILFGLPPSAAAATTDQSEAGRTA